MSSRGKAFSLSRFMGLVIFLVAVVAAASGWILRLDYVGKQAAALQEEVGSKQIDVMRGRAIADGSEQEVAMASRFAEWKQMVDDESLRVEALSVAAESAGVTIISLRGLGVQNAILEAEETDDESDEEVEEADEPTVVALAHEIEVAGGQRELAGFLDGIYRSPGRVAVDELLVKPGVGDQLNASLLVRWYGPMEEASDEEDENG